MRKETIIGIGVLKNKPEVPLQTDVLWAKRLDEDEVYVARHWPAGWATKKQVIEQIAIELAARKNAGQRVGNFVFERLSYEKAVEKGVIEGFETIKFPPNKEN
jgi:hypothetical protein